MNRIVALFFGVMFVIGTDMFIASPLLPTLRKAFDVSVESSGWIVSAYALGYAVFALLAGPLSDGWNRKKVLIVGMLGFALFTMLCGFATSFWLLLLFRFLAGIGAAFASPQVWASIPQLVPPKQILRAMGIATAGLGVSQVIGVPIGSFLAVYGWPIPYITLGACSLVIVAFVAWSMPPVKSALPEDQAASIVGRYRALLS
ncbi:MFS transporter [Alicyclobacillus cycloheptanicus]|uniref:Multidrug resistance protein n=1 Tax=Alicyclobacillus cycloheptanicus TaxID=1457 RepID=A0ABT9XPH7_9BACL|nr:MFS transporter [Alicyclobacillus cycloheptanicus]MDQ0191611.1 multidrug resistance protein [Alicyclobacillus cycloheptanicus]